MYTSEMLQTGLITESEYKTLAKYTNLSDVIITYSGGVFTVSDREITEHFNNKADLLKFARIETYYILDMYRDIELDRRDKFREW